MKLLFTGNGRSGSWKIRGEQIGQALDASIKPYANCFEMRRADIVFVVKRITEQMAMDLRGLNWVWDIVDAYPQPECTKWGRDKSISWARKEIDRLKPRAIIWPNRRMKDDVGFDGASIVIEHHHRPNIKINPIREKIRSVGYEGSPRYITGWEEFIQVECKRRGWSYVVNPENLADVDVVLALRGAKWNAYAVNNWKSNVKLANAHGSCTPFIGAPEQGYLETSSGCEYWAEDKVQLSEAFDRLESQSARQQIADRFLECSIPIEKPLKKYRELIGALRNHL